ncbi:hypothetical protein BOS5A_210749 [Bosea sp. EC-HK365B]|nr:hypothetical protein BOSE7B_120610 [Bosea sp. 7B]CAD5275780.1 hypothetical protein BOSE21B_30301 [Bosea sp. 21B]VVT59958.1 hypothetical protein BOS5A_210749 [Bosea sp. EC-HK365B]VXC11736.1 hypothetical protein BOSE127_170250 [Bosea sp. 127]
MAASGCAAISAEADSVASNNFFMESLLEPRFASQGERFPLLDRKPRGGNSAGRLANSLLKDGGREQSSGAHPGRVFLRRSTQKPHPEDPACRTGLGHQASL